MRTCNEAREPMLKSGRKRRNKLGDLEQAEKGCLQCHVKELAQGSQEERNANCRLKVRPETKGYF